jgi:hypothetical protein
MSDWAGSTPFHTPLWFTLSWFGVAFAAIASRESPCARATDAQKASDGSAPPTPMRVCILYEEAPRPGVDAVFAVGVGVRWPLDAGVAETGAFEVDTGGVVGFTDDTKPGGVGFGAEGRANANQFPLAAPKTPQTIRIAMHTVAAAMSAPRRLDRRGRGRPQGKWRVRM